MAEQYFVGIDLGTTYSCLACIDEDGNPAVVKNFEEEDKIGRASCRERV